MYLPLLISLLLSIHSPRNIHPSPVATFSIHADQGNGNVDPERSKIYWRGTKLMGTRFHEGTVSILSGNLEFEQDRIVGGQVLADMTSIYNTDIPLSDPIPRKNLTAHLNSDFDTKNYPEARFSISRVRQKDKNLLTVTGELTIKGVANPITVPVIIREVSKDGQKFETTFSINRFKWGIGEDGSWLEKKLVDEEFELRIELFIRSSSGSN